MTGSIAVSQCGHTPNRPGHHGTVVASTVGTVAISCNDCRFLGRENKKLFTPVLEKEGKYISSNDWLPDSFSYWDWELSFNIELHI